MNSQNIDVLVIGGGIMGVCVARELKQIYPQVLLVEKDEIGKGCSYANAGWVTPCFAMPLPQPGMLWKSIKWLADKNSPLYIKPELSPALLQWLLHFMRAMNEKKLHESISVLTEISKWSLLAYQKLAERTPTPIYFDSKGLLMVSAESEGLRDAHQELDLMSQQGIAGRRMTRDEILNFEPALQSKIKGGVFFSGEAHLEPFPTTQAIHAEFARLGGKTLSQTEVFDFALQGEKILEVRTTQGNFRPSLVVLTAGSWSIEILKKLNIRIPLMGGKGYSMHVRSKNWTPPQRPIMIVERKIAITPRTDSVRLAGTLELVNQDFSISPHRVQAIYRGAYEYLHMSPDLEVQDIWRGLRPCTPDGVPLIGFSKKISNLFYCLGHQMLGIQSAPGSAKLAADLVQGQTSYVDPKPFRPERFERSL